MTRLLGIMALVTACGFAVGCSDDDDLADVIDERIDDLDIDDDLVVTRNEWNGGFIIFDLDNDRVLTTTEFRFNGNMFTLADVNADGFVTEDEWEDVLDDLDIDGDDLLELAEFDPFL
jgi:hypothetical protein